MALYRVAATPAAVFAEIEAARTAPPAESKWFDTRGA
jgi:hypothetical protein